MAGAGRPRPPAPFTPDEQRQRLTRLEALDAAIAAGLMQADPEGLAPDRIVVFETNASVTNILKAAKLAGFHHFQELAADEDDDEDDDDAPTSERERPTALYIGLPNEAAVKKLIQYYRNWKDGRDQPRKLGPFNELFKRLIDVRLWGPRDRLTEDDLEMLRAQAKSAPDDPVLLEVELWPMRRPRDTAPLVTAAEALGAKLVDQSRIDEQDFWYQALLFEIPTEHAANVIDGLRDGPLGQAEDIYAISPASHAQSPPMEPARPDENPVTAPLNAEAPIKAVLIDGAAIANHPLLRGGVVMEDVFEHENLAAVQDRRHATAMASVILRGDLRDGGTPINARILNIPLLIDGTGHARANPKKLLLDQVHRALKRALLGDNEGAASAPEAFVVNLSIGVANRVYANRISGLARLLDWWAEKHGVLFVIAAGNTTEPLLVRGLDAVAFEALDANERAKHAALALLDAAPRRALLAPAECINGLTVGATATSSAPANPRGSSVFHPFDGRGAPSIISRSGFGARGALKPDILAPGGRPRARIAPASDDTRLSVQDVHTQEDALVAAAPPLGAISAGIGPTYGTSPAAASATRTALQIVEGLESEDGAYPDRLPRRDRALIAKALLTQSAQWGDSGAAICDAIKFRTPDVKWSRQRKETARLMGLGATDPVRAIASDDHRVTCVGFGRVLPDKAVIFTAPLPEDLNASLATRRIVITLAWFSPVSPWRSKLSLARLQADIVGADNLALGAAELLGANEAVLAPPPYFGRRGSVWTGCYKGKRAVAIGPESKMDIRVSCFADAVVETPLRFAIATTFETEAGVPIYASVAQRLRQREQIRS
jgi:Subtilase family